MMAGAYICVSKVLRRGPVQIWLVRQQSRAASRATSKAVSRVELSPEFGAEQGRAESREQRSTVHQQSYEFLWPKAESGAGA